MILLAGMLSLNTKPNVMLIVADDQGYANIGYHNKSVLTPRIDALAAEGRYDSVRLGGLWRGARLCDTTNRFAAEGR